MRRRAALEFAAALAEHHRIAGSRLGESREDSQQRGFSGAIAADEDRAAALFNLKGDIAQDRRDAESFG